MLFDKNYQTMESDDVILDVGPSKAKILFVGDQKVGKTSLVQRYDKNYFSPHYVATIGTDFLTKTIYLSDWRSIKFQIWDIAGKNQQIGLSETQNSRFFLDCHALVAVYDVTNTQSFESALKWLDKIRSERGQTVQLAIVGNKTDLEDQRKISKNEAEERIADALHTADQKSPTRGTEFSRLKFGHKDLIFIEASAKHNEDVEKLFHLIAESLIMSKEDRYEEAIEADMMPLPPSTAWCQVGQCRTCSLM